MDLLRYKSDDESGEVAEIINRKKGKVITQPNEFAHLRTRVTNLGPSPVVLTANLFFEPLKHVIFHGTSMNIPIGRIEGGHEGELQTPVCFVSCGKFELRAEIHVFDASQDEGIIGKGRLVAIVKD